MIPQLAWNILLCLVATCANAAEELDSSHLDAGTGLRTHRKRGRVNYVAARDCWESSRSRGKRGVVFMTNDGEDVCFAMPMRASVCLRHNDGVQPMRKENELCQKSKLSIRLERIVHCLVHSADRMKYLSRVNQFQRRALLRIGRTATNARHKDQWLLLPIRPQRNGTRDQVSSERHG